MTDTPATPANTPERIAKVIARSGVASRRDAEKMILAGRVTVNGKPVTSPALDVSPKDKVAIDGKPIDAPQETRVWLYYKPLGLVTTEKDEQGRRTIFDEMPEGMPRVLNVGRLDLNSEGLLLLTNDGGLKRRLELPETGWLRKYRVRVNGRPTDDAFRPLREGITIDGEDFMPMEITLDRQQGANAWLTVGLREGKNREIRRAMTEIGLTVNRLIRVSYGPFRLNEMQPGEVVEIKRKVLRDQMGDRLLLGVEDGRKSMTEREEAGRAAREARFARANEAKEGRTAPRSRPARGEDEAPRKGFGRQRDFAGSGDRPERSARPMGDGAERKPRWSKAGSKPRAEGFRSHRDDAAGEGAKRSYGDRPRSDKPWGDKPRGDRPQSDKPWGDKPRGDRPQSDKPWGDKPRGDRPQSDKPWGDKPRGDRPRSDKPWGDKPRGDRPQSDKPWGDKPRGDRPRSDKPWGDKPRGDRPRSDKPWGDKPRGDRPQSDKPWGDKPRGDRPRSDKPWGDKPRGDRPQSDKPWGDKPRGDRPQSDKPWGDKPRGDRPFAAKRDRDDGKPGGFKSQGFKSHGGAGKPRAAGFKSHGAGAGRPQSKGPRGPKRD
ncbi:pseudouridine synthase [Sedimentimonas flavescens]|uniref:pseudouridine synthase n=1 Tax=Sedimentimonas flavescens TaxID=2851012 RepID=UPI0021A499B8|nr:pseudouridine synthase [Sedimentimonas flavescens]MCT2539129.1 pseudouridine synthase [Sedimentimonas flavescens]